MNRRISYVLNDERNFNEILRKDATYDNIKGRKTQGQFQFQKGVYFSHRVF